MLVGAPHLQAKVNFSACGGKLMQEANGVWVFWGEASGQYGGLASLDPTLFMQGLGNGGLKKTVRLDSLATAFASTDSPDATATRIFCSADGTTGHAVLSDGTLVGWGNNTSGQIGNGDTLSRSTPAVVAQLIGTAAMVSGTGFTVALLHDGTVVTWGANMHGQIADGTTVSPRPLPNRISGLANVVSIAAGSEHALALLGDGTLRSWGRNAAGQLGNGTAVDSAIPVAVSGLDNVMAVAAGVDFSLALKTDGTVWAWGANSNGSLGNGSGPSHPAPVRVGSLVGINAITTNRAHTVFALASSGQVWGWGANGAGGTLLGAARTTTCPENFCTPEIIAGLPLNIDQVFAHGSLAIARTSDAKLFGWGSNVGNQLAQGRLDYSANSNHSTPRLLHQGTPRSDFDRDHVSDFLLRSQNNGDVWLWNRRDAVYSAGIAHVSQDWVIAGTGDADGDGRADIFWRNSVTGENSVWFMDNRLYKGTIPIESVNDPNWKIAAIADVDGDGRADILWRNEPLGQFAVWLIGAGGVQASRAYAGVPSNWQIRGAADFDGDGKADMIWRDAVTGAVGIYRMGGVTIAGVSFLAGGLSEWEISAVADVDRDGRADIVFSYLPDRLLARVKLNAAATQIDSTAILPAARSYDGQPPWQIEAVGDFNGDTHTDILWRQAFWWGDVARAVWYTENLVLPGATEQERTQRVRFLPTITAEWQLTGR